MGIDRAITFPSGQVPAWTTVRALLVEHGYPVPMRMIDGELAFPDEEPNEPWRELRVGAAAGMVTVRREGSQVVCVTWGNADAALTQLWNALAWAFAEAGQGQILTAAGTANAADFARQMGVHGTMQRPPK